MTPGDRRWPATLCGLLLVVSACGGGSSRQTELPPIPEEALPPPVPAESLCRLAVGGGKGAEVVEVFAETPAARVFEASDVVVEFGGEAVSDSSDLVRLVGTHEIGDSVGTVVTRDGQQVTLDIELIESPSEAGTPIIGVRVMTAVDLIHPAELAPSDPVEGPFARVLALGGDLYVLDPVQGAWQTLPAEEPAGIWLPSGSEIYALEPSESGPATLIGVVSGDRHAVDAGTWQVLRLLTSVDDLVLAMAERPRQMSEGITEVEPAVVALDPIEGVVRWEWVPGSDAAGEPLVPWFAYADAGRDRVIVALAAQQGSTEFTYVILDSGGRPATTWPVPPDELLPEGSIVLGWFDDETILFVDAAGDGIYVLDIEGSETTQLDAIGVTATGLWPVGDGRHALVRTDSAVELISLTGERFVRRLMQSCVASTVADPGWGVLS